MRIIKANGLDLELFQFDYDQTWAVIFVNADRTIYGRYGTRTGVRNNAATHISVAGFKKAMERALETHKGYPANKGELAAHAGPKPKFATPEKNPSLFKGGQCIHCHTVHDGMLRHKWMQKELTAKDLYVYPLPENIGIRMDVYDCLTVKRVTPASPAAQAAIEVGDRVVSINGTRLHSQADIQWLLHQSPGETKLAIKLERGGKTLDKSVTLSGNWKETELTWRESSWYGLRQALHLAPLTPAERTKRGIAEGAMAYQVKNMYGAGPEPLRKAGLKINDVIVAIDGKTDLVSETKFWVYLRTTHPPGSKIKLKLLRGEQKLDLEVPSW